MLTSSTSSGAFALALADRIRDATEAAAGMTGAAPAALVALRQFLAGRTTEDLAQATGLTHSGAVRLVDRFVDAGLAERRPGRDGRSLSIVLTASGRALEPQDHPGAGRRPSRNRSMRCTRDDRRALLGLIDTLVAGVTAPAARRTASTATNTPVGCAGCATSHPVAGRSASARPPTPLSRMPPAIDGSDDREHHATSRRVSTTPPLGGLPDRRRVQVRRGPRAVPRRTDHVLRVPGAVPAPAAAGFHSRFRARG